MEKKNGRDNNLGKTTASLEVMKIVYKMMLKVFQKKNLQKN